MSKGKTAVNEITGNQAGIRYAPGRDWHAKTNLLSSVEKAQGLLGCQPQTEFETGLRKVYEWFVENWDNIKRDAEF